MCCYWEVKKKLTNTHLISYRIQKISPSLNTACDPTQVTCDHTTRGQTVAAVCERCSVPPITLSVTNKICFPTWSQTQSKAHFRQSKLLTRRSFFQSPLPVRRNMFLNQMAAQTSQKWRIGLNCEGTSTGVVLMRSQNRVATREFQLYIRGLMAPSKFPRWGTIDTEIKVPSAKIPELSGGLFPEPGIRQNISLHASPTASYSTFLAPVLHIVFSPLHDLRCWLGVKYQETLHQFHRMHQETCRYSGSVGSLDNPGLTLTSP